MSNIDAVTAGQFEARVLQSRIPVFVDFYTPSCGPCRAAVPVLEDMAQEFDGEVKIVKVDIEAEPSLAETYGVSSVPTFLMIRDGAVLERISGGMTRGRMAAIFERHVEAAR